MHKRCIVYAADAIPGVHVMTTYRERERERTTEGGGGGGEYLSFFHTASGSH